MKSYPIPMVPGPVHVPEYIRQAYLQDYGSADMEPEFLQLYNQTEKNLQTMMNTKNQVAIMTGEGMLALWSALKSCLVPGDRVLALATGMFGYDVGEMAKSLGAQVKTIGFAYNETLHNWPMIEKTIVEYNPKMITAIHCETPSGTLNPLQVLGELKNKHDVPLLYVDMVASLGGVLVETDAWNIDLALGGSQKVFSAPADMSFLSISQTAWNIIESIGYSGYDALLPFRTAQQDFYFPYTPHWHGVAAMHASSTALIKEGLTQVFSRHEQVSRFCRLQLQKIGYTLFSAEDAIPSPTVTAVNLPDSITWEQFDSALREQGLVVGGSYGPLKGKVFRLGHMGSQADMILMERALSVLAKVFHAL